MSSNLPDRELSDFALLLELLAGGSPDVDRLAAFWTRQSSESRRLSRNAYLILARAFLKSRADGALLAYDVAVAGLEHYRGDRLLRLVLGQALARTGGARGANEIGHSLLEGARNDEEVLGLVASTYKDMARIIDGGAEEPQYLEASYKWYLKAYQATGGYWTGINAAALAVVRRKLGQAKKLASAVEKRCQKLLNGKSRRGEDPYWLQATLGEAALIRGDAEEAIKWFQQAAQVVGRYCPQLARTRTQVRFLLSQSALKDDIGDAASAIDGCFRVPKVVIFVGHMVDRPDRKSPRLPDTATKALRGKIKEQLKSLGEVIGYSSAACGSDILFQEVLGKHQWDSRIVLPYNRKDFCDHSVAFAGPKWVKRYDRVLARAGVRVVSPMQTLSWGGISYEYANRVLTGLAALEARQLGTELIPLAVWNGSEGDGEGGTCSIVRRWRRDLKCDVTIIDPRPLSGLPASRNAKRSRRSAPHPMLQAKSATEVRAIMFADVVKFSGLTEEQMPVFVEHFLKRVSVHSKKWRDKPIVRESRGDGFYFVFKNVAEAGRFALRLSEHLNETRWTELGLPDEFKVRIGLHAGPVYRYCCPFSRCNSYTGHHVIQAARIEPKTPPGIVYASQAFAALTSDEGVRDFDCEYAGILPLPKSYGTIPVYHVRRR